MMIINLCVVLGISIFLAIDIYQSTECGRFHRYCRLVTNFTIGEVGMRWSTVWKGISDVGWSTKKILERIGWKFQKCGSLDINSKSICT